MVAERENIQVTEEKELLQQKKYLEDLSDYFAAENAGQPE